MKRAPFDRLFKLEHGRVPFVVASFAAMFLLLFLLEFTTVAFSICHTECRC